MTAKRFASKEQAAEAAALFPLSGPVWISGAIAQIEKLPSGWYVAFPKNISRRYLQDSDFERRELSITHAESGWL